MMIAEVSLASAARSDTVLAALAFHASARPREIALQELQAGGAPSDRALSWADWLRNALHFAAALIDHGCAESDRVAVLAGNTLTWPVADIGIMTAGCIGVGVFPTSASSQVAHIVHDAEARLIVVDGADQLAKVAGLGIPIVAANASAPQTWDAWLERGRQALERPQVQREVLERIQRLTPDRVALLIYTSGSTGEPKGAVLTHECISACARSIGEVLSLTEADSQLSFLPFSHAGERLFGHYTRIVHGAQAGLVVDHNRLFDAARAYQPTVFGGLPRFFEKVYESLYARHQRATGDDRARIERGRELGTRLSQYRQRGLQPPADVLRFWANVAKPEIEELRAHFGGRVRIATSGGATLPTEVSAYLDAFGLTVLGAYGLTEHLCATMNRPERYRLDTVGVPMPGTELRIADDGEIMIRRCALSFSGYINRPEETAAAFTPDGTWLLTGDLGAVDAHGMLRITGRKKDLIALSTGKKVAPLPIEARLSSDPLISQVILCGEGRKYITALVSMRKAPLESWAESQQLRCSYEDLLLTPELRDYVQTAINAANDDLSKPERIRKFHLLDRELTAEEGELTTTQKVKRALVQERYRDEVEALYAEDGS